MIPLVFFFVCGNFLIGQVPNSNIATASQADNQTETQKTKSSNNLYFLVKESFPLSTSKKKFLKNDFSSGVIFDYENTTYEVDLRYRFFDDEMQVMHLGKIKALTPQRVNKIIFKNEGGTQVFIPSKYLEKGIENLGFFEVKAEGKMSLLVAYRSQGKKPISKIYFYKNGESPAQSFSTKKSKFLKIFGDKKSQISKYIVSEKLSLKKEKDLLKIFEHYNTL